MTQKTLLTFFACLISFISHAQMVDGGNGHAIILDQKKQVWTVGRNIYGQLGTGDWENRAVPVLVEGLPPIVNVSRGYDHCLAIDEAGCIWSWGKNNYGQLGQNLLIDHNRPTKITQDSGFVDVAGGSEHSLGLKKDGTVLSWGHNYFGELGNGNREHSLVMKTVKCKINGKLVSLQSIVKIATVGGHALALDSAGTIWAWGPNQNGQTGHPYRNIKKYALPVLGIPHMKEIATGWHHSVSLDSCGQVWVWGSMPSTQMDDLISYEGPTLLKGMPPIKTIACGSWHSMATDLNGEVWAWGRNSQGMLAQGNQVDSELPVKMMGLKDIEVIGGGCHQSMAVDSAGDIWTCGFNCSGQQGVNDLVTFNTPQKTLLNAKGELRLGKNDEILKGYPYLKNLKPRLISGPGSIDKRNQWGKTNEVVDSVQGPGNQGGWSIGLWVLLGLSMASNLALILKIRRK